MPLAVQRPGALAGKDVVLAAAVATPLDAHLQKLRQPRGRLAQDCQARFALQLLA